MKNNVTGKDVAKLAGVSLATVSYVLNDNSRQKISRETRERVLEAAKQLGYVPNRQARGLRSRRAGCVSVMLDKELEHPRYARLMQGLRQYLEENGYRVLLCGEEADGAFPRYLSSFLEKQADGIVYIGADGKGPSEEAKKEIRRQQIPFVMYDCVPEKEEPFSAVLVDYREGMERMVQRLTDCGCSDFLYLCPASEVRQEAERRAAFAQTCAQLGLRGRIRRINLRAMADAAAAEGEAQEVRRLLADCGPRTGVIFSWTWMLDLELTLLSDREDPPKLGVLSEEGLSPVTAWFYSGELFYATLCSRECGTACGEEILRQIRGEAQSPGDSGKPRIRLFHPRIGRVERRGEFLQNWYGRHGDHV